MRWRSKFIDFCYTIVKRPRNDNETYCSKAVAQRCSVKKVFLEILLNSTENTPPELSFNKVTGLRPSLCNLIFIIFSFIFIVIYHSTLSWRRPLPYRNQSTDLLCKSMDWFLYDNGLSHEIINLIKADVLVSVLFLEYFLLLFDDNMVEESE